MSPKNVTASVWISDTVVVIVLVFLLTIDCRKKEGDSLEGRGFTGVKAAVIEYWHRAYRAYCLQFFAA
ncbi:MAG TPA: hypothetical protein ACQGQJ_09320 [Xylella fastidiosa subsp. multiplex]